MSTRVGLIDFGSKLPVGKGGMPSCNYFKAVRCNAVRFGAQCRYLAKAKKNCGNVEICKTRSSLGYQNLKC